MYGYKDQSFLYIKERQHKKFLFHNFLFLIVIRHYCLFFNFLFHYPGGHLAAIECRISNGGYR